MWTADSTQITADQTCWFADGFNGCVPLEPPDSLSLPVISPRHPIVGTTLSTTTGSWSDPAPTFSYQWYLNGVAISGATSSTYLTTMRGSYTVLVTATNADGSGAALSDAVNVTKGQKPRLKSGSAGGPKVKPGSSSGPGLHSSLPAGPTLKRIR